jgi:hypothetical protein
MKELLVKVVDIAYPEQDLSFLYLFYQDSPSEEESTQQIGLTLMLYNFFQQVSGYNIGQDMVYND